MTDEYYQYDCDECGETIIVTAHPDESTPDDIDTPNVCPKHSAVEIDYTVKPKSIDPANITILN